MAGFEINLGGKKFTIKEGDKVSDLIKKPELKELAPLFDLIDNSKSAFGGDGVLDTTEIEMLQKALSGTKGDVKNYDVDKFCEDYFSSGKTRDEFFSSYKISKKKSAKPSSKASSKAFNEYIQNAANKYDKDQVTEQLSGNTYKVRSGNTLYNIAKKALQDEGKTPTNKEINERMAQIALVNNIKDVNNLKIGTELKVGTTPPAAGGTNPPAAGVGTTPPAAGGTNPPAAGVGTTPPAADDGTKPLVAAEKGELAKAIADKNSSITVSPNGLNMGSGMPVDKDGNELKDANGKRNFKDPKFKAGGYVMKYTSGETVMYQITRSHVDGSLGSEVKLSASSIEELKELDKNFHDTALKVKPSVENETEEQAKARKAENLAALKELVTLTNGNIQVIKNVAAKLRDDDYVDRTSDEYKAFVQDLLLTRNADVINAMFPATNSIDTTVLEKDKTAHEILAGMYQEIRAKEKAGEKLSDEEIELKESLGDIKGWGGYKIEADPQNGIHEKYMNYGNIDGTPMYQVKINDNWYYAKDPKLLDEFSTKLESADTDDKKSALFKKYINTQDTELAKCLARNVKILKAKDEDIISLVKSNGMEVLATLPTPDDEGVTYSEDVFDAVLSRAKEIVTTDRGNLENAIGLDNISYWINNSGKTDEEKDKIRTEILETYFKVTQDEEGNKTYTFNPSRRPTYEEMLGLATIAYYSYQEALVKYTKLEDMGKGQYNEAIERWYTGTYTVPHYAEMVEKMNTKEEVIDFIDNKVATDKKYHLPFDKIIEKFPNDKEIADKLVMTIDNNSTISEDSKLKLVKHYMKTEGDKVTFDKTKLPEGYTVRDFIDEILPKDCQKGDAAKYFEAVLDTMNPEDNNDDFLSLMDNHKYSEAAGNKIAQKVEKYLCETGTPDTDTYNRLAIFAFNTGMLSDESKAIVYEKSSNQVKQNLINNGYDRQGSLVVVKQGDSIDKIVKEYLANHLDKFPRLKESVESNKEKWTPERINEALNDYMNDFRAEILKDLGISDPTKVKAGEIIDLGKVRWDEHQPGWWNYNFNY